MAMHTDLPIHKAGVELVGLAVLVHAQLPRGFKRTVGDKIVSHCAEMLDFMAMANATRFDQRIQHLRRVLMHVRAVRVWFRVGFDLRKISTTLWAKSVQLLDAIGKQANGWLSNTREKAPAA